MKHGAGSAPRALPAQITVAELSWPRAAVLTFRSEGIPQRMGDDEGRVDQSREGAAEKSLRPDIQAGALRMKEGGEPPEEHRHPSYRETSGEETIERSDSEDAGDPE